MNQELLCQSYWDLMDRVRTDPEYARLNAMLQELEPRYEALLAALPEQDRSFLDRYITLRESMGRRTLEFACNTLHYHP